MLATCPSDPIINIIIIYIEHQCDVLWGFQPDNQVSSESGRVNIALGQGYKCLIATLICSTEDSTSGTAAAVGDTTWLGLH